VRFYSIKQSPSYSTDLLSLGLVGAKIDLRQGFISGKSFREDARALPEVR